MSAEQDVSKKLAEIEAKRAERKAETLRLYNTQRTVDLEVISDREIELGDGNVSVITVPYTAAGLPVTVACKCPSAPLVKRYRDQVKPRKDGSHPDYIAPAEQLAASTVVYPEKELFDQLCELRPGLKVQLGLAALKLGTGAEEDAGKGT